MWNRGLPKVRRALKFRARPYTPGLAVLNGLSGHLVVSTRGGSEPFAETGQWIQEALSNLHP